MQQREPFDIHQAGRQWEEAAEQHGRVLHLLDPDVQGRKATADELATVTARAKAKEAALRRVCAWPCKDFAELRAKAKVLNKILLTGETMRAADQKAFIGAILQMGKAAD